MTVDRGKRGRLPRAALLSAAILALALSACGDDDDGGDGGGGGGQANAAAAAPDTVNFGIAGAGVYGFPVHDIAKGIGEFDKIEEEFGTTFEFPTFESGPDGLAALQSGAVDTLMIGVNTPLAAAAAGQDLRIIFPMAESPSLVMLAPTEHEARGTGMQALSSFDGDSWGVTSVEGTIAQLTRTIVEAAGLDWDAQKVVATGAVPATVAAVTAGRVDIAVVDAITAAQLIEKGEAYQVLNMSDPDVREQALPGISIYTSLNARPEFLEEYPELAQAIVEAEMKGLRRARELDSDAALELLPQSFRDAVPPEVFARAWELDSAGFHSTGLMPAEETEEMIAFLKEVGLIAPDDTVPPGTIDNSLAEEAAQNLE